MNRETHPIYPTILNREVQDRLADVGLIIGYCFFDSKLLLDALTAAGSTGRGATRSTNGNKRLAVVGDTVLQLVLANKWYDSDLNRANLTRILQDVGSNANLNAKGHTAELDDFIYLAGGRNSPAE
ncbi:MAG: hypothetical protein Q9220_006812 [cf. Caloplaca sp. 1 TL-2023]